jgi:hypothetical protein
MKMQFCPSCGGALTDQPTESSWERIQDCIPCNIRYHTRYGDVMGGGSDSTISYSIPKVNGGNDSVVNKGSNSK